MPGVQAFPHQCIHEQSWLRAVLDPCQVFQQVPASAFLVSQTPLSCSGLKPPVRVHGHLSARRSYTNLGSSACLSLQVYVLCCALRIPRVCFQEQYHGCLAGSAPFCNKPGSTHARHFQALMGEAMILLAVFSECKPEQFLACQSSSMLDGSRMPPEACENLKVAALKRSSHAADNFPLLCACT